MGCLGLIPIHSSTSKIVSGNCVLWLTIANYNIQLHEIDKFVVEKVRCNDK